MSLANIRRLLQEDTVLRLPAIVAYATTRKQVVSIIALQTCPTEDGATHVTQICMLHINTQGQVQWTYDMVTPQKPLPALWLRQNQLDEAHLAKFQTWRQGWSAAMHHMSKNNILVVAQNEDLDILKQQFIQIDAAVPEFSNAVSIRDMFHERHPNKSISMKDMAAYYQVYLDPDKHLKASIVTYAKLLERMLAEQPAPIAQELVLVPRTTNTADTVHTLEDAKKWIVRAEAGARTATDFFEKISEQFSFKLVQNQHGKIQGYAILVDGQWVKGTQLGSNLGWAQICQDHHWKVDDNEMHLLSSLQYKLGA